MVIAKRGEEGKRENGVYTTVQPNVQHSTLIYIDGNKYFHVTLITPFSHNLEMSRRRGQHAEKDRGSILVVIMLG